MGVQNLHPGRIAAPVASLWFLIGEASQAAQVTPIGAGQVAAIGVGQQFADIAGNGRLDGWALTRTQACRLPGLVWSTTQGSCPCVRMASRTGRVVVIQIDEDVAGVASSA